MCEIPQVMDSIRAPIFPTPKVHEQVFWTFHGSSITRRGLIGTHVGIFFLVGGGGGATDPSLYAGMGPRSCDFPSHKNTNHCEE
jgi:hypothetical protein